MEPSFRLTQKQAKIKKTVEAAADLIRAFLKWWKLCKLLEMSQTWKKIMWTVSAKSMLSAVLSCLKPHDRSRAQTHFKTIISMTMLETTSVLVSETSGRDRHSFLTDTRSELFLTLSGRVQKTLIRVFAAARGIPRTHILFHTDILSIQKSDPWGTRTGYLCVRRLTPYPFSHGGIKCRGLFWSIDLFADTCKKSISIPVVFSR